MFQESLLGFPHGGRGGWQGFPGPFCCSGSCDRATNPLPTRTESLLLVASCQDAADPGSSTTIENADPTGASKPGRGQGRQGDAMTVQIQWHPAGTVRGVEEHRDPRRGEHLHELLEIREATGVGVGGVVAHQEGVFPQGCTEVVGIHPAFRIVSDACHLEAILFQSLQGFLHRRVLQAGGNQMPGVTAHGQGGSPERQVHRLGAIAGEEYFLREGGSQGMGQALTRFLQGLSRCQGRLVESTRLRLRALHRVEESLPRRGAKGHAVVFVEPQALHVRTMVGSGGFGKWRLLPLPARVLNLRPMRLLDRYLLREFMVPLTYCLTGFLIFWVSFDVFSFLDQFKGKTFGQVLTYYSLLLPELLSTVLPVALLLALLFALTKHSRSHELVAIRASGVSLWRLSMPYFLVGIAFSLLLFSINNWIFPRSAAAASDYLKGLGRAKEEDQRHQGLFLINEKTIRRWQIGYYDAATHEMFKPIVVEWRRSDGVLRQVFADYGVYTNQHWKFSNTVHFSYQNLEDVPPAVRELWLEEPEVNDPPEVFDHEIRFRSHDRRQLGRSLVLTLPEIFEYLEFRPHPEKADRAIIFTQLHGRLAAPWTCLVVVFIALPFGVQLGRTNPAAGVAAGLVLCFGFFVLSKFGMALGSGGRVPPWLGAWLPNLVFTALGIFLIRRHR